MKKKVWQSILSSLLTLTLIVGCSSSTTNESASPESKTDEQSNPDTEQVLVFGSAGDAVSLDPSAVTDSESEKVAQNIFDTLVAFDEGTSVQPSLAESWKYTEDGLKYTFELRKNVKFHDGTDFNAAAVVFNFNRWMNADESKKGVFAQYATAFGGFKGDEAHVLNEVKATGDYTVEFTFKSPQPTFLKNLSRVPFAISSPTAIEKLGEEYGENPVGTGPFVFKEWKRSDRIVLDKNPNYWQTGFPKLNKVIFRTFPDNAARLNALIAGEIDIMDGLDPSNISQIKDRSELQLFTRPSLNVGYLGFTTTRKPFDNKLVRQALSHAVDKQGIIDAFYAGQADPAKNPIPPAVGGYNDQIQDYEYNLDKAKALLAEAGYPNGFEMDLWAMPVSRPYMPDARKVAEVMQASFAQIGVKVNIRSAEWATYLEEAVEGKYDTFLLGWTGTNGDADDFIYTLLDKDNIGSLNSSRYANEELHKILIEARSIPNEEKRIELYKKAQEIIHEDAPWVPLAHSTPVLAGKSGITGFQPHPTGSVILTKVGFE